MFGIIVDLESRMNQVQSTLSSETTEKARLELNENPDTLHQDVQQVTADTLSIRVQLLGGKSVFTGWFWSRQVRDMIVTRPDIGFLRTDDEFIVRFLRARKFDHLETFRLLAQYFQFRQQNLDMFQSFKVLVLVLWTGD